ncbi:hypothetical protein [Szabonella alba]|uniref:Phage tail tape measure protein, lambda family n=1 Tax=Szabonella alba TaxID=2804194 RepID=A0A8K0XZS6_9RHOB|nr:hypothetical protein [Szabonella alba]MBL4917445.1 hypothetical protein [Szabonella alba]
MSVEMMGLIVKLEAQQKQFKRDFDRAIYIQRKAAQQMETRAKQSADRIAQSYEGMGSRIGGAFKTIAMPRIAGLAGAAAGIGVAGAVSTLRRTVQGIAEIGDAAKRAGMQVEAFQEWRYVAEQNRIGIDALTDGFKELNLRADEFVITGKGSAAEAFQRLGFGADDLKDRLKDPSELMLEIIRRLEGVDKAAQIRIADEIFGGSAGERFVELLDRGANGIRNQIDRARDLGLVMDEGAVRKAAELDAKFAEVTSRLQTLWRTGVVGAAEFFGMVERERAKLEFDPSMTGQVFGDDMAASLGKLPEVGQDALAVIEGMRAEIAALEAEARQLVPAFSDASLMLRGLGEDATAQALTDLATRFQETSQAFADGTLTGDEFAKALTDVTEEATETLAGLDDLDKARLAGVIGQVSSLLDWIRKLPAAVQDARREINSLEMMDTGTMLSGEDQNLLPPGRFAPGRSIRPRSAPALLGEPELPKAGSGGAGGRSQSEFDRVLESLNRERMALEAEAVALVAATQAGMEYADAIDFARIRAELLNAAKRDGRAVTPELTAEVDRLAEAHLRAGQAAQKSADDMKAVEQRGKRGAEALTDTFMAVLDGSKSAEEALADLLIQMAKVQFQKALMGIFEGSGVGEFVGGLLGFADGGFTGRGGKHEPAGIVHRGEYVFSKQTVQRLGAGNLHRLHESAKKGYASGGLVGDAGKVAKATGGPLRESTGASAPAVTINAPITVQGSAGTTEQNADLAKQVAAESERMFRGLVRDELVRQMRPGGLFR